MGDIYPEVADQINKRIKLANIFLNQCLYSNHARTLENVSSSIYLHLCCLFMSENWPPFCMPIFNSSHPLSF
jgi:hypothetical protein